MNLWAETEWTWIDQDMVQFQNARHIHKKIFSKKEESEEDNLCQRFEGAVPIVSRVAEMVVGKKEWHVLVG